MSFSLSLFFSIYWDKVISHFAADDFTSSTTGLGVSSEDKGSSFDSPRNKLVVFTPTMTQTLFSTCAQLPKIPKETNLHPCKHFDNTFALDQGPIALMLVCIHTFVCRASHNAFRVRFAKRFYIFKMFGLIGLDWMFSFKNKIIEEQQWNSPVVNKQICEVL